MSVELHPSGEKRQTNHHREVAVELLRGVIPKSWLQYKVSGDMTAALWVADFARRVQQLERVVSGLDIQGDRSQ